MAITVNSPLSVNVTGRRKSVQGSVSLDNSYPTGGYPLTLAALGLSVLDTIEFDPKSGYQFSWDGSVTAPKLVVHQGDNTNAAAAPGIQVTNGTNLSAVTNVRFTAVGA